ncbi:MAG: energy transducer TonB [Saprospiraceae bacterium]|nr:energy transducer TonB [Saprospiraceae bacterium]
MLKASRIIMLIILPFCCFGQQDPVLTAQLKEDTTIYPWVDIMPIFYGCKEEDPNAAVCSAKEMTLFLYRNMQYPADALASNTKGICSILAIVEKSGKVLQSRVKSSSGSRSLDNEAQRLVANMPPWTPGIKQGRPVRVEVEIPVNFNPLFYKRE